MIISTKSSKTQDFTLIPASESPDQVAQLFFKGKCVRDVSFQEEIIAQFQVGDCYLIMMDENTPFEGGLFIMLLDRNFKQLDCRQLGIPYQAGWLDKLDIISDRELHFSFFGNDRWRLEILDQPQYMWRNYTQRQPCRQWSKIFSRRHLQLSQISSK